jgi:hypothetical protein
LTTSWVVAGCVSTAQIGTRNVAALCRVVPECATAAASLRLGTLVEHHLVTAVERLLQMLGARLGAADQLDPKLMDAWSSAVCAPEHPSRNRNRAQLSAVVEAVPMMEHRGLMMRSQIPRPLP